MIQINDEMIQKLGLGNLPESERKSLLAHFVETLELRVGMRLAQNLTDEQLDEFERLLPVGGDSDEVKKQKEAAAMKWLETNYPNYKDVVQDEFNKLQEELKRDAEKIRSVSEPSNETPN